MTASAETVTILFTNLVGSTGLPEITGTQEGRAQELLETPVLRLLFASALLRAAVGECPTSAYTGRPTNFLVSWIDN
jgi:hypothetical protein